jgi:hypothetical protein
MDSEMKLHNSKKDNTMTKKKKGLRRKATSTNHYIENEIFSKSNMKTLPNPNLYIFYKNFTRVFDKIQGRRPFFFLVIVLSFFELWSFISLSIFPPYLYIQCDFDSISRRFVLNIAIILQLILIFSSESGVH